jgi:putative heme iron utilization protein
MTDDMPSPRTRATRQPGEAPLPDQPPDFDPIGEGKALLRGTRAGALATLSADGFPFASLVSVATDLDGSPLMLLSRLSVHTQNLLADPRVSLLLSRGGKGDPLAHPRLTVLGRAQPWEEGRARRRFLARHPKSALYADFADFLFVRIGVEGGHLNGGFARAARLSDKELLTALDGLEGLAASEADAIAHMNSDHADALALYATRLLKRRAGAWRLTGLDPEGLDLALGDETARLAFPSPLASPGELRPLLVDLARRARAIVAG